MNETQSEYRVTPIEPMNCLSASWNMIKEDYWLFLGIVFVGMLIGSFVPLCILLGPMMCGIYMCYFAHMRGEKPSFDLLFKGFNHFTQSLIATLIIVGISFVVTILCQVMVWIGMALAAAAGGENSIAAIIGIVVIVVIFLVMMIFSMGLSAVTVFAYPLIVDRGLKGTDALMLSVRACWANIGGLLSLILLMAVLGMVGALACCIGMWFVAPISMGAFAIAYRKIFPALNQPPPIDPA